MKNILFPFKMENNNKVAYAKAMDMAKQMNAKVIFFTVLPEGLNATRDKVYFHLLDLYGHYQTNYNDWQAKPKVKTKRIIEVGDFEAALKKFLERTTIDWIVPTEVIKGSLSANHSASLNMDLIKNTKINYPHLSVENN